MGLKAIKGAAHRKSAHLYPGQQTGNIKNACWDRSHGQGTPPDMGPLRIGTPPEMGFPQNGKQWRIWTNDYKAVKICHFNI